MISLVSNTVHLRRSPDSAVDHVFSVAEGYPFYPVAPEFVQDVHKLRTEVRDGRTYVDPATRADPNKRALFAAAKEVNNLTTNIGVRELFIQLWHSPLIINYP